MRKVNRSAPPLVLSDPDEKGKIETKKNINHAERGEFSSLVFEAYKAASVKEALVGLFQGKCAYCESKFLHTYPGDIEHFRPKGRIMEAPGRTYGYYWLAAEWDNLLLSCRNCNQKLSHEVYGELTKLVQGKMDQFPLKNEDFRLKGHADHDSGFDLEEENRLLIDPCKEDPKEYFDYDEETGVIKAKAGEVEKRASSSIKVFALQRMPLVQAREKLLIEIRRQEARVLQAILDFDASFQHDQVEDRRIEILRTERILTKELQLLKKFTNPDEEFSGLAEYVVTRFLEKHSLL